MLRDAQQQRTSPRRLVLRFAGRRAGAEFSACYPGAGPGTAIAIPALRFPVWPGSSAIAVLTEVDALVRRE